MKKVPKVNQKDISRNTEFRKVLRHPALVFIQFFIIMLFMFSAVNVVNSEDFNFSSLHQSFSFSEFLTFSYHNRNGRYFVQTLYYFMEPLQVIWSWICATSVTLSAFMIFKFITFTQKYSNVSNMIFALLCCFSIGVINSDIVSPSMFWVTGAYSYLIPFTLGLIGFAPFFYTLQSANHKPGKAAFLYVIPALLTIVGQEQIALCLLAFSLIVLIYLIMLKRVIPKVLWVIFLSSLILQIFSLSASGTSVRFTQEIARWFPEFPNLDLTTRLSINAYYLLNTIINQWYLLLIFLWITVAVLLKKFNKCWYAKLISLIMFGFALLLGLKYFKIPDPNITDNLIYYIEKVFTFHYLNPLVSQPLWYVVPYIFWTIAVLVVPVSIYLTFKKTKQSLFYILLFMAAMASIVLMTFSPTLFVSGGRTSFVSNMLLIILILFLLGHADLHKTLGPIIIGFGAFGLLMLYWTWQSRGFDIFMGNLDVSEIPFIVRGIN